MRLVEIVRLHETEPAVFEAVKGYVARIGKTAVTCQDTPGFIVNRLLVPALVQAMLMKERGEASVEDIDVAMQLGAGHPMGPLHLVRRGREGEAWGNGQEGGGRWMREG